MSCASCGEETPVGATFCGSCGVAQTKARSCASCGSPIGAKAQFCPGCGNPVPLTGIEQSRTVVSQPSVQPLRSGGVKRLRSKKIPLVLAVVAIVGLVVWVNRPSPELTGRWIANCDGKVSIEFRENGLFIMASEAGDVDSAVFRTTEDGRLELTGEGESQVVSYSIEGDRLTFPGTIGDLSSCSPWSREF